jgi:cupin fold WbuC family metalloprotein
MSIPVFYAADNVAEVTPDWYERLKSNALGAKRKRSRLCLHHGDDDLLHEMIIVFHRDAVIRPHRHARKSESYHIVFGALDVVLFDDNGHATRIIHMGDLASGKTLVYRKSVPVWHSLIVRSEFAAVHEVTNGPFRAEENEFAPWSPEEEDKLREFLDHSVRALRRRKRAEDRACSSEAD